MSQKNCSKRPPLSDELRETVEILDWIRVNLGINSAIVAGGSSINDIISIPTKILLNIYPFHPLKYGFMYHFSVRTDDLKSIFQTLR